MVELRLRRKVRPCQINQDSKSAVSQFRLMFPAMPGWLILLPRATCQTSFIRYDYYETMHVFCYVSPSGYRDAAG